MLLVLYKGQMRSGNHCDRSHVNTDSQKGPIPMSLQSQFQKRRQMSLKCLEASPKCFYPCVTQNQMAKEVRL